MEIRDRLSKPIVDQRKASSSKSDKKKPYTGFWPSPCQK